MTSCKIAYTSINSTFTRQCPSTYFVSMGLLKQGTVLTWEETKEQAQRIKTLGVTQFLRLWDSEATRHDEERKWGDEVRVVYRINA
jgi:hypothetical protein